MCGIVGIVGDTPVTHRLLDALQLLEYRGYDSAGVATLVGGSIQRRRAAGKLQNLVTEVARNPIAGTTGIGHTRWATHGAPTKANAHPHATSQVALVHNGIIENYAELRDELTEQQRTFVTDTDTEVIVQLVDQFLELGLSPVDATHMVRRRLRGNFAVAMIFAGYPELMIGIRQGAPLAVGVAPNEMYLGSDSLALSPFTDQISFLQDGDCVVLDRSSFKVFDANGSVISRKLQTARHRRSQAEKGAYRFFMEKELYEHPEAIRKTITEAETVFTSGDTASVSFHGTSQVLLTGCGGAYFAALLGQWWIETIARTPARADVASEYRYRNPPPLTNCLGILVSQSGETADTLAALQYMKFNKLKTLAIVNVPESSIARDSDAVLETHAGPEIGVASTKAFTAQLAALAALSLEIGLARGTVSTEEKYRLGMELRQLSDVAAEVLALKDTLLPIAEMLVDARSAIFLGRGAAFPVALEGALKLKEIGYIHAEAFAAGELKHGPIALIDPAGKVPVIAINPTGPLFDKTTSNLQEVVARGGRLILMTDADGAAKLRGLTSEVIVLPKADPAWAPVLYAIAVQLLAFLVAVIKGNDIDQPRNLAKSVTVE